MPKRKTPIRTITIAVTPEEIAMLNKLVQNAHKDTGFRVNRSAYLRALIKLAYTDDPTNKPTNKPSCHSF